MKMTSSTSITSTNGVTLMSLFCSTWNLGSPAGPESLAAMDSGSSVELPRNGVHQFGYKTFRPRAIGGDAGLEVVVADHRRDGREQTDTGGEQGFGDTRRHNREV